MRNNLENASQNQLLHIDFPRIFIAESALSQVGRARVDVSHHCQRGTANTTLQLATQTGLILGLVEGERIANNLLFGCITILLAVLMFVTVTWPYFKQKRVRP